MNAYLKLFSCILLLRLLMATSWGKDKEIPPETQTEQSDDKSGKERNNTLNGSIPSTLHWKLVESVAHDETCFTQGLTALNASTLIETCGLYGRSKVHFIHLIKNSTNNQTNVSVGSEQKGEGSEFYEGSTIVNRSIYSLTWKENRFIKMDVDLHLPVTHYYYPYHGWGLTYDHQAGTFFASNGSQHIMHFKLDEDTNTTRILREVPVECNGMPLMDINELEYDGTYLYANVWYSDVIWLLDPYTGGCIHTIRLHKLWRGGDVLNGIALAPPPDDPKDRVDARGIYLWVTGKLWKEMHLIFVYL